MRVICKTRSKRNGRYQKEVPGCFSLRLRVKMRSETRIAQEKTELLIGKF